MKMLLAMSGSFVLLTFASAGLAQNHPVNAAGYATVSLAEAGLEPMPVHPPSDTETSAACAHVVRRVGEQTASIAQESQGARDGAPECRQAVSRRSQ